MRSVHPEGGRRFSATLAAMAFLAVAAAMALLYGLWVAWVPLLPSNVFIPLLARGRLTAYAWASAILFLPLVVWLFALYAAGYALLARGKVSRGAVFAVGGLFCFELLWASPETAV